MTLETRLRKQVTLFAACIFLTVSQAVSGQEMEEESYRAWAVNMSNVHPGGTTTLQLHIKRWSTDEERQKLFAALAEHGQEGFVDVLRDLEETGWVRLDHRPDHAGMAPSTLRRRSGGSSYMGAGRKTFPSERLRYARAFEIEDTRRIVLALDRPIPYWEAVGQPRTIDYDLTMIVIDLDQAGEGEGRMAIGVELELDMEKKVLEIESFATEPVRLMEVHRQ